MKQSKITDYFLDYSRGNVRGDSISCGKGCQSRKWLFLHGGRKVLEEIAKRIPIAKGSYDIRMSPGGPAVSGEVTLHGERVYVQISADWLRMDHGVLVRSCDGRADYSGGTNFWMPVSSFNDIDAAVERIRRICRLTSEGKR